MWAARPASPPGRARRAGLHDGLGAAAHPAERRQRRVHQQHAARPDAEPAEVGGDPRARDRRAARLDDAPLGQRGHARSIFHSPMGTCPFHVPLAERGPALSIFHSPKGDLILRPSVARHRYRAGDRAPRARAASPSACCSSPSRRSPGWACPGTPRSRASRATARRRSPRRCARPSAWRSSPGGSRSRGSTAATRGPAFRRPDHGRRRLRLRAGDARRGDGAPRCAKRRPRDAARRAARAGVDSKGALDDGEPGNPLELWRSRRRTGGRMATSGRPRLEALLARGRGGT